MVLVHSATKGMAAMTLAVAHSRGWLDYEERICNYWPEFAQRGKDRITVRQLLAHQAGLHAFDERVDHTVIADLDRLAGVMARQRPAWVPGTRQAYHAISLGFYQGELMRRIDPWHRSLGQFFQDEIATPLELDFYIRLPETVPDSQLANLEPPSLLATLTSLPVGLHLDLLNSHSPAYRSLVSNPGTELSRDEQRIYARNFEVPSGGGVGNARDRSRLRRVCCRRARTTIAARDFGTAGRSSDPSRARFLRRVPERRSAILAGLYEAECGMAFRESELVRIAGSRPLFRLCRSASRHWIRLRHKSDEGLDGRFARCSATSCAGVDSELTPATLCTG